MKTFLTLFLVLALSFFVVNGSEHLMPIKEIDDGYNIERSGFGQGERLCGVRLLKKVYKVCIACSSIKEKLPDPGELAHYCCDKGCSTEDLHAWYCES